MSLSASVAVTAAPTFVPAPLFSATERVTVVLAKTGALFGAGVLLVTVSSLKPTVEGLAPGAWLTVTVAPWLTAAASARLTGVLARSPVVVDVPMVTAFVSARSTAVPATFTVNSDFCRLDGVRSLNPS